MMVHLCGHSLEICTLQQTLWRAHVSWPPLGIRLRISKPLNIRDGFRLKQPMDFSSDERRPPDEYYYYHHSASMATIEP
jgi:hypothetical protein